MTPIPSAFRLAPLHFAWQGLLVFVLLRITLFGRRQHSPNAQYLARCVALAALAVAPLINVPSVPPAHCLHGFRRRRRLDSARNRAHGPAASVFATGRVVRAGAGVGCWRPRCSGWCDSSLGVQMEPLADGTVQLRIVQPRRGQSACPVMRLYLLCALASLVIAESDRHSRRYTI